MVNTPPPQVSVICTHERRPGTTVCLHCRHAARLAARVKRKRLLLRGGAVAIVIGTFIAAGTVGATAIRGKSAARKAATADRQAPAEVVAVADPTPTVDSSTNGATPAPAVQQGEALAAGDAPLRPIVPTGAAPLRDGMSTLRADSVVTVLFDTPGARTRIPEKFERLVRATLPAIYGPAVDSVLAKMPQGAIAKQGLLVSEMPGHSVQIPIGNVWSIRLFPETRPGQDGPIVVRYRVSVVSQDD